MPQGEYREGVPAWLSARSLGRALIWTLVALLGIVLLVGGWFTVDAGERAIVLRFGAIQGVYAEGFHFKIPAIDKLVRVDVRVGKHPTKSEASSRDLQIVHTEIMLNYHPEPSAVARLHKDIGLEWESRIIDPAINETFKAVTARYTAEQLVTKREEVSHAINASLKEKLTPYGLVVEPNDVNITDFDFSPEFNKAIEEKVTAEQRALKAQRDLERIQTEAEQRVAAAEGEARALRAQRQEVTPELIRLREVENQKLALEKWNGQLPQYVGSGPLPFIDISPRR